jgi:organic hydroperoxide reductase OsmC/OhrA
MAKALGGKGDAGKTNPEELFAAGYGEKSTLINIHA